jgi:hypothetical protein
MWVVIFTAVMTFAVATGPAVAEEVRYWGPVGEGDGRGLVELGGQSFAVRAGDELPGWGTVAAVTEEELILYRRLSEAERRALGEQGGAVYDVQEIRLRNLRTLLPR